MRRNRASEQGVRGKGRRPSKGDRRPLESALRIMVQKCNVYRKSARVIGMERCLVAIALMMAEAGGILGLGMAAMIGRNDIVNGRLFATRSRGGSYGQYFSH